MFNEEITVSTWPNDVKGFYGYLNFLMQNSQNQTLAYANSVWVYVDTSTGLPTRIDKDITNIFT